MKKTPSIEQDKVRRPRASGAGKPAATAAATKGVNVSAARKGEPAGLLEEHFPDFERHAIKFDYVDPAAREVLVAGSFNGWQPRATPMTRQPEGRWSVEVPLRPGDHEYRFVVDGRWQDDPAAVRFVPNPFGSANAVVQINPSSA